MSVIKRTDGWWIVNVPDTVMECGPYRTRREAERDMAGMAKFFRALDRGKNPFLN